MLSGRSEHGRKSGTDVEGKESLRDGRLGKREGKREVRGRSTFGFSFLYVYT